MYNLNNLLSEHKFKTVKNGYNVDYGTHVYKESAKLITSYLYLLENIKDVEYNFSDLEIAMRKQIETYING